MKTVGTKLDNSEYEIFDFMCQEKGLTKSEQLRDLIKNCIDAPSTTAPSKTEDIETDPKFPVDADGRPQPIIELVFDD